MTRKQMRDRDLLRILAALDVHNENGDKVVDFQSQGRDALDFASVNRRTLQLAMQMAFQAGAQHASRHHMSEESARAVFFPATECDASASEAA